MFLKWWKVYFSSYFGTSELRSGKSVHEIQLVVSILIMFLLYQLQLMQDRLVLDTQNYCDDYLIRHLQVPAKDEQA